jgi:putative flippase GtrA
MKFVWNDAWTGKDKQLHFLGCALVAFLVAIFTSNIFLGFVAGSAVALVKDLIYDLLLGKGTASLQDIVVSLVGSVVGAIASAAFGVPLVI